MSRFALLGALLLASPAFAGMPSFVLSDLARARVQTLSFFAALLLLLAFAAQWLWNGLRTDFPTLPLLGYRRALSLVVLFGLAFHLVLTMISGARELLTPGAWEKQGATYKLRGAGPQAQLEQVRRERLLSLRSALFLHADANGGQFPAHEFGVEVAEDLWRAVDPSGARLIYVPGAKRGDERPLAIEPDLFGGPRLSLWADGSIRAFAEGGH